MNYAVTDRLDFYIMRDLLEQRMLVRPVRLPPRVRPLRYDMSESYRTYREKVALRCPSIEYN